MTRTRIIATHRPDPVPPSGLEWEAHSAGSLAVGYGATEIEAVADLLEELMGEPT